MKFFQEDEDLALATVLASVVVVAATLLMLTGCGPVPTPSPVPPPVVNVRTVAVVALSAGHGVSGATCSLDDEPGFGPHKGVTNADGYVAWNGVSKTLRATQLSCSAEAFAPFSEHRDLLTSENENLAPAQLVASLPAPPSREEILNVRLTFQGLSVDTAQFGRLPWFEAALPWLSPADRQAVYAAKHASTAWPGGDTHALIFLPSGPPLYDEPGQPYSADRFGALDWTAGNTAISPALADLVVEVARAGFPRILLFLGGDDGERGYPIATQQLALVADALQHSAYGDLRPYVVPLPGWDGVFYGYTPQHIFDWGAACRARFTYCGIEHSTGHIPTGEGDADWIGAGGMRSYDLLLSEFDDGRFDDTVWQIGARLLGPLYRRPPEQPAADDPHPPFYLREATPRGPIVNCAFEFGEYTSVHQGTTPATVATWRAYFRAVGYPCGG